MSAVKKTVLIVEADPNLGDVLELYFAKHGEITVTRYDGGGGYEYFENHKVDLVILDRELPDGDGMALCGRMRESSGIPIIMISARAGEGERIRAVETGADLYLTKPFSPAELVRQAGSLLRRVETSRENPRRSHNSLFAANRFSKMGMIN